MPFGFGSITSFANKAVSAATNAASEAAKVAEKAVDTAAKAAETATAQVAAVAGEPPPAGQAPAARPAAPRAAAPRPQVPVQQAPRAQAPQMQQGPQMQTPAPQQQVQPRPPVSQQQQQQQQQPQQPPMQRHTTPPQQAQTQQQHQQPPPPQQQQQPPQQQMQQQQPPQQQMQQQQPPQQQMQQPQQHVPLTHQSQNVPQSQPQSVNQAPMPQQSQHQAQNQLDQPISTHGGPLPPQGPPNQPGVSVSGPMGGPIGNQGPPGQGPPFPSSPGPRGPRGMRPPMGPRGPMGPNAQMGSNTSMGPGGPGGPMGPRGMRPGGPRMRGPRPGMMGPGSRPGLSPSGLLRGPRPMSGPSGDMGDSMSGGPLLNQNGPPGSEFGPPNSMGPLQMGLPPHSMSDVPGDNSSSSMGFPQGMSSQPNQSGMNPNQQGPMNSDTNLVGNSGANNPHINDMSSGGMLPPHSSNSGPFPDQQHQSFNNHLQNGVMKLSLPPLDLDSSFPPLSSSNMDLFPLFDAQLPPFSSSSSLLPMLNSSLPPFDTSLPTDPFPPSEYQRRASLPNGPYSPVVSRSRRMSHQPPPHIEISSQDSSASNQGGSLAAHITHEPVRSPLWGNRSPEVSLKKIKSLEDEYDKIKLELLSGLDRDEELFSPCGPEIVPPLQKDQGPGSTRLGSATIGHTEASSSKSKRSKDNLESIFGESFDECGDGDLDGEDENEDTDERRRSSSHKHHNKTANRRTRHQSDLGESSPEPPDPRDRRMQTEIVEPSHTKSFMRDADTDDVLVDVNDSRNDPSRWQHARSNANINTSQVDSLKSGVGVLSHLPPSTTHVKAQHLEDDPFPVSVSPELELPAGSKTAPMSSSAARLDPFLGPVKERRSSMATGEVYTIPEMPEEEAGSPTTGDGVSCRRNRRGTATTSLIMSFPGLLSPKSNGHKEPSLLDGLLGLDEQTRKLRQKQQHQVFSKDENLSPIVIKAPNSPRKAMLRSPLRSEPSFEIRSSLEESPEKPVKSSPSQKSFVLSSIRQIESKQDSSNRSGSKESKTQHMAKASSPSPDDSPIQPKDFLSKVTENSSKFISSRDDPMGGSYFMEGPLGGSMDMFNTKSAKDAYNTRSFSLTSSSPPFPSSSPPMMIPESFGREGKDHHHQSPSKVNGMFSKQRSSSGLSPNDEYGSDRRKQFMTTSGNTVELSKPERLSERRDRLNFAMKRGNSSKSSHLNDLSASHDQLSPILDSSPLIEKIESNREKFRDQERQREREREESRKYRDENQHGTSTNRLNHHAGQYGNQLHAGGNNAQLGSSGQPQGESISGMLNNFSKALGNIRDIREKRMKNLGNSPRPSPSDPSSVNYQRIMQQYGGNQYSQGVQQGAQQQRSQYNQMHPQQMNQQQYRQQQPYQQQNYNQQGRMNQQGGGGSGGYGMNQGQQPQQGGYGSYNQQQQQPMGGGMKPNNYGGQMGGMQNHSQPQQQQPMGGVGTQGSQYQQSYMGQQNLHPQQQQSNQMMGGMPQQGMMNQQPQHLQPHQQQQQQQPMGNQMLHPQQSQQQNLVGRHYMSSQPSSMVVQHQPNIPSQFVQPQPTTTYIQSQPPQLQQPQLHQTSYGTSPLPGTGTVVIGPQIAPSSNVLLGAPQSASLYNTSSLGQPQQPTLLSQQSHLLQPQTTQQTLLNALLQQQQQQQQSQQPSTSPNFLAAALAGQHHASLPQTSLFSQINPAGVTHTSLGPLVVHQPQPQLPSAAAALSQAQLVSSSLPAAFTNPLATATNNHLLAASAAASDPLLSQAAASQQQQLLLQNQQLQLQQQQLQLKKMQQRLPHVSGAELKKLQKQIRDLQQQQQLQTLQTLRLAQKQEQQAFKYLNKAIQNRPSRTYQTSHQGKTGASSLLHRRDHLHHHGSHHQPLAHIPSAALLHGATLVGTPDTLSEAGSFKSRTRRTLPYLPLEEPAPMPSEKKQRERMRAFANLRQSSLDGLTGRGFRSGTGGFYGSSRPRASSSETNLRKLAMNDHMTRPGSALGLLQASTVVSSKGPTSQTREHEKRILESILPPDLRHLVRGGSPGTIQQMKMKLEDELRKPLETMALATNASEGEMARKKAEARLFGLSGAQSDRIRLEMQRYATMRDPRLRAEMKHKLNPVLDAQLNRNRRTRGHRRNLSDPRFSTSLTDSLGEDDLHYSRPYSSLARDYDPLSDSLGMDNSRSYLGGSALDGMGVAGGGGGLRDTAINSHDLEDNSRNRYLASLSQQLLRRSSEGGSGNTDHLFTRNFDGTSPHTGRRAYSSMSGRAGPRSWHPSPFASDDDASSDEPQFFKEEKKNRIKMEIARRRQQIEENACLHEELTRLAKLRESAEMTGTTSGAPSHLVPSSTAFLGGTIHPANRGMTTAPDGTTSVLKSVDEILRDGGGGGGGGLGTSHHLGLSSDPFHSGMGVTGGANAVGFRGAGMGTFNSDLYTSSVYDRVTDFSPINSELSEFTTPRHMGGGGVGIMGHHHGLRTSAGGGVADDPFWSQGGPICSSLPPRPNSQPSRNQLQRQMSLDPEYGFDKAVLSNAKPSKWSHSQSPRRLASLGPGNEVKKVPDNYGTIGGPTRKPKLEGAHNEFSGKKQTSNLHVRSGQDTSHTSEYPPLRRILLTKEVNKDFDGPDAFGIRLTHDYVPGTDGQYQGCVVSKVFHGSRADFHGEIYEGDEVKEINGIKMAQKSDFEIKQILNGIRGEADLICRSFTDPFGTHRGIHPLDQITGVVPLDKVTRDDQYLRMNGLRKIPEIHKTHRKKGRYQTRPVLGQVELLLSYDYTQSILYVTVIRGRGLQSFVNGDSRPDAFIMGCLLPQSVYNVRKTRYVLTSSAPLWNDTFVYQDVPISSLRNKSLEISAWSFNRDSCNEYLGELVLDLADLSLINEKPRWFQLFEKTSDGVAQFTLPNGRIGGNFHESRSLSSVSFSKGGSLKLKRSIFGQFFNRSKSITDSP